MTWQVIEPPRPTPGYSTRRRGVKRFCKAVGFTLAVEGLASAANIQLPIHDQPFETATILLCGLYACFAHRQRMDSRLGRLLLPNRDAEDRFFGRLFSAWGGLWVAGLAAHHLAGIDLTGGPRTFWAGITVGAAYALFGNSLRRRLHDAVVGVALPLFITFWALDARNLSDFSDAMTRVVPIVESRLIELSDDRPDLLPRPPDGLSTWCQPGPCPLLTLRGVGIYSNGSDERTAAWWIEHDPAWVDDGRTLSVFRIVLVRNPLLAPGPPQITLLAPEPAPNNRPVMHAVARALSDRGYRVRILFEDVDAPLE